MRYKVSVSPFGDQMHNFLIIGILFLVTGNVLSFLPTDQEGQEIHSRDLLTCNSKERTLSGLISG